MKKVAIIDYGSGNLHSAAKAFERVAGDTGHKITVTANVKDVAAADYIVLPGVGAFGDCRNGLDSVKGMVDAISREVLEKQKPFLGICVGMQLLADAGLERGRHKGLGLISGEVAQIKPKDKSLKIPHMGWNEIIIRDKKHKLFKGIKDGDHAYFVHSYHFVPKNKENVLAEVEYGGVVTAAIAKDNIMGVQFHPEKSQETGLKLIKNFLSF